MREVDDNKDKTHPCLVLITSNDKVLMVTKMILARGLKTVMTQRTTGPRYSDNKATFHERTMMSFINSPAIKGSHVYDCLLVEF